MAKPSGEKTEKPSARKLKKAKANGEISRSPEVASWLTIMAASFLIPAAAKNLMAGCQATMIRISGLMQAPEPGPALGIARTAITQGATAVAPMVILILATSISAAGAQGGIRIAPKLLMPKFSRLNPISGAKRMFGPHGIFELSKSLGKMTVLAGVAYLSVRGLVPTLVASGSLPISDVVTATSGAALDLVRYSSAAGIAFAFLDMAVVRRRNNKQLKMTKQEVKEEHKSNEGDPQVKAAIRSRALALSRSRMMADVATADVLVVNPTHFAVALKYEPTKGAPRVVAKGGDYVALQIRKVAEENRVPIVQDIPLARTLYASCKVGHEIPADLYFGVAAVLAFVMRLKRKGALVGEQRMQH